MKNKQSSNTSEVRAEQATNNNANNTRPAVVLPDAIYLGLDLHKKSITLTRIIDHSTPQPAQTFTWPKFWDFAHKQTGLAKKIYAVYEAGAFGFWAARRLKEMGIECFVVHPEKLDPHHKRVQTDKLDSRHLADKLQRYVLGNKRAMVVVHIPTLMQEQQRLEARHRRSLHKQLRSLQRRGASLLLSQGIFATENWWKQPRWEKLCPQLCPELQRALADDRAVMEDLERRLTAVEKTLKQAAPAELPKGFGQLTFVLLVREICDFERFKTRRNVGGFTGLCGGVASSGPYHVDLSINKAGNGFIRMLLVELAWRMTYFQPNYTGLKVWKRLGAGGSSNKRRRKAAIVAVARQLAIDVWKWQTGQVTPQELGWEMASAA